MLADSPTMANEREPKEDVSIAPVIIQMIITCAPLVPYSLTLICIHLIYILINTQVPQHTHTYSHTHTLFYNIRSIVLTSSPIVGLLYALLHTLISTFLWTNLIAN